MNTMLSTIKKIMVIALVGVINMSGHAQEIKLNLGVDVMSRYVWRGTSLSNGVVVQPSLQLTKDNLTLGVWGSSAVTNSDDYKEVDLSVSYTFLNGLFTVGLTDYYIVKEQDQSGERYFNLKEDTKHVLEAGVAFSGSKAFPVGVLFAMNCWGADKTKDGGQQHSMYVELNYSKTIADNEVAFSCGITPFEPDDKSTAYYGVTAGIVNLGVKVTRTISLFQGCKLPVSVQTIVNPMSENVFLVAGIHF
ncbi:hypothetical protein EMN47_17740 [Prolixibacteraceae bacterium JC049]|nr:hypothetical protein [Prolixibacteraceae bacterium JC049]